MSKHFLLASFLATLILSACSNNGTNSSTNEPRRSGNSFSEPEIPQQSIPEPPPLVVEPQQKGEKSLTSMPQVELKMMPSGDEPKEQKTETSSPNQNLATPLPQNNIPQTAAPKGNLPSNDLNAVPAPATNPFGNSAPQTPNTGADPFSNTIPQTTAPIVNSPVNSNPQPLGMPENAPAQP